MKSSYGITVLGTVFVFVLVKTTSPSLAVERSFFDAQEQCFQYLNLDAARWEEFQDVSSYPDDLQAKQLVRCIGLMLRFWDDCDGVNTAVIKQFFHPDCSDKEYLNRTNECLQNIRVQNVEDSDTCDVLTVAYETFHCYYHQYGNVIESPQFVPWTVRELQQIEELCREILNPSPCEPEKTLSGPPCLMQCILLQAGLLSSNQAVLLDRVYLQYNQGEAEQIFKLEITNCVDKYRQQHDNSCLQADLITKNCFHHERFMNRTDPSSCTLI